MTIPILDHLRVVTDHHEDNIQRMRTVYRFSSLNLNRQESVAEHVWFVTLYAALVGELYEQYRGALVGTYERDRRLPRLDWKELLLRITVHDLDESLSGDFLRKFKYSDPELTRAIKKATESLAKGLFKSLVPGSDKDRSRWYAYWKNDKANDVTGRIVGWCDLMSVVSYAIMEIRMGNRNLYPILSECMGYVRELADLPEPMYTTGGSTPCNGWCSFIRAQYNDLCGAVQYAVDTTPKLEMPDLLEVNG